MKTVDNPVSLAYDTYFGIPAHWYTENPYDAPLNDSKYEDTKRPEERLLDGDPTPCTGILEWV